jgi:uncharacterized protein (TIGR04255 family)
MSERPQYANAPIVEAVIDLRIVQPDGLSVSDLQSLVEENAEKYPAVEEMYRYQEEGYVGQADAPIRQENQYWHNGFRCISGDRRRVFYASLDGLAFSMLAPYEGWTRFSVEARRLWEAYRLITAATSVTRIAVRYINRIDIPLRESDSTASLEDYIRVYPELPSDFPPNGGPMNMYFLQVQVPQRDIGSLLVINSTPQPTANERVISITLDFDLFRQRLEDPWEADNDESIWGFLESLHERKNEVFEASITDLTRRLIR